MRRPWALCLLLVSSVAVLVWLLVPSALQRPAHRGSPTVAGGHSTRLPTASSQTATALVPSTVDTPQSDRTSRSFSQRVRCTQVRFSLHRVASPDVLELLCERRALSVLRMRSEEHTSELQSRRDLVCRLLLEKKKNKKTKRESSKYREHDQS